MRTMCSSVGTSILFVNLFLHNHNVHIHHISTTREMCSSIDMQTHAVRM